MSVQTANSKMISQDVTPPSDAHTRLHGRRLLLARVAWLAIVGLTVMLYLLSLSIFITRPITVCTTPPCESSQVTPSDVQKLQQQGLSVNFLSSYYAATDVLFTLVYVSIALVIFWRKSDDWMAMLSSLMLVTFSIATFSGSLDTVAASYPALNPVTGFIDQIGTASLFLFFYLFPDGRFVPRWTRWILVLMFGLGVVGAFFPDSPFGGSGPGVLIGLGSILFVQIYRYWRVSGTVERQQTKWVVFGTTVAFGGFGALILLLSVMGVNPERERAPSVIVAMVSNAAFRVSLALIPLSLMIAILRYRLWEIDILINRTLVYVPLTAILAGIFAASITLSQKLFVMLTGAASDAATVLTTLIVVAAFTPLKDRLQALVDRRFKEAPDPAKKLKAFSEQVRLRMFVVDVQAILRRLLEESVAAFEASGGAAYLETNGNLQLIHTAGEWKGEAALSLPLEMNGTKFGVVSLCARHNGAEYTAQDRTALQQAIDAVTGALMPVGRSGDQIAVIAPIIESPSG